MDALDIMFQFLPIILLTWRPKDKYYKVVVEEMKGSINNNWIIPIYENPVSKDKTSKTIIPWILIEDTDSGWNYKGFKTRKNQWNASGGSLTFGYENCKAEIKFKGKAMQYFAYRSPKGEKSK